MIVVLILKHLTVVTLLETLVLWARKSDKAKGVGTQNNNAKRKHV